MPRGITVDRDLLELMPNYITIERFTGYDSYGQRKFDGRPFKVRCRIEGKITKVIAQDGSERVSSVQVFLAESPGLTPNDRITMPSGTPGPAQPNILSVNGQPDQHGPYYEAIYT